MNIFPERSKDPRLLIVCILTNLLLAIQAFSPSIVLSFSLPPGQSVTVFTEYRDPGRSTPAGPRTWIVRNASRQGESSAMLNIYPAGSDAPFCVITLFEGAGTRTITLKNPRGEGERSSDNGLFILPGYPAPVNVLPLDQPEREKFYDEKRTAGGRVFVRRYRVFREEIDRAQALDNGWIKTADPSGGPVKNPDKAAGTGDQRPLWLWTVMGDAETPVVRQLWREVAPWWIYEETPLKRSWRVE